jgi:hypothetical protein
MPNALLVPVPGVGHWTLNWNPHLGCLLAATTAFIQAGQPASPAWDACTRALAGEPMPFPALKPGHTEAPLSRAGRYHPARQRNSARTAGHQRQAHMHFRGWAPTLPHDRLPTMTLL